MTATLPFGRIACEHCNGRGGFHNDMHYSNDPCHICKGEGHVPDPWYGDNPREIIEIAKPVEDVLLRYGAALLRACKHTDEGVILQLELWAKSGRIEDAPEWEENWWNSAMDVIEHLLAWSRVTLTTEERGWITVDEQASLLRCLIGHNPRTLERVGCPRCKGKKGVNSSLRPTGVNACPTCKGRGAIPVPFAVDPRWKTSTVLDLAWEIRGGERCSVCKGEGLCVIGMERSGRLNYAICGYCEKGKTRPQLEPNRLAILADALLDAGADDEDMIHHLRHDECHTPECWILELLK